MEAARISLSSQWVPGQLIRRAQAGATDYSASALSDAADYRVHVTEMMIPLPGGEAWADDSGDGPPLILVHPGVGDSRIWDPVMPALTATHRVIRYDARGFGRSPAPTVQFSLYDDLLTVLDHFQITRTPIVGCSQGGDCALGLAVLQPQRVSALVLLCPGISGYRWPDEPEIDAAWEQAEADGVEALAQLGLRLWGAAGSTPAAVEQLRSAAKAWLANEAYSRPNPEVFDRLGEISVPTSLMIGDLDRASLIDSNLQAAARIPGCELLEVPGLDHLPPLRVPELVVTMVYDTLSRI
jgi:pimeloyl-ACP methyl ester carboxylesterase